MMKKKKKKNSTVYYENFNDFTLSQSPTKAIFLMKRVAKLVVLLFLFRRPQDLNWAIFTDVFLGCTQPVAKFEC